MTTKTHCPAVAVPVVVPCDPAELAPLVDWLAGAAAAPDAPIRFPRGTVLPDGRLDLCKQSIGPGGAQLVLDALREHRTPIRAILFGTGAIGDTGAAAVAAAIDDGVALETVYLGCNKIGPAGAGVLAEAIARSPDGGRRPVDALWLKRNPLGIEGARRLAELVTSGVPLRVLDAYNCELGDDGVAVLAEALASPQSRVEHVYLGGNAAGPRAAEAIGALVAGSTTLRSLQLSASRFADCAPVLAAGLAKNAALEELGLASCGIDPGGGTLIANALARHPRLLRLDFGVAPSARALGEPPNRIADAGAPAIADLVRGNPPLRALDLRWNGITSRGAMPILEAMYANHSLVELRLAHFIAKTIRRSLRRRLAANAERIGPSAMPPHVAAIQSVYRTVPKPP